VSTVAGGIPGLRGGQEEPSGAPFEREQCRLNCYSFNLCTVNATLYTLSMKARPLILSAQKFPCAVKWSKGHQIVGLLVQEILRQQPSPTPLPDITVHLQCAEQSPT
jgi:hypothetical protein